MLLFMTTHLDRVHRVVHRPEEILLSDVGQQTFQTRFEVVLFREAEGRGLYMREEDNGEADDEERECAGKLASGGWG